MPHNCSLNYITTLTCSPCVLYSFLICFIASTSISLFDCFFDSHKTPPCSLIFIVPPSQSPHVRHYLDPVTIIRSDVDVTTLHTHNKLKCYLMKICFLGENRFYFLFLLLQPSVDFFYFYFNTHLH